MPDPNDDQADDGEEDTVTLTGYVTDEAWERLADELAEIRTQEG